MLSDSRRALLSKSGRQWLKSRVDFGGYEEYSGTEYRSAGCSEEYLIVRYEYVLNI